MIESLPLVLTGLGLTASIIYYANILNNANKTRELQLKAQDEAINTRNQTLHMQLMRDIISRARKTLPYAPIELVYISWDIPIFETVLSGNSLESIS